MDLLKQVNSFIILVLLCISIYFVWDRYIKVKDNQIEVIQYLDSIAKVNDKLFTKVDSLNKLKVEQYKIYEQLKLKYDTVQIHIDTIPSVDATRLLLSISRQLTAQGIE